MVETDNKLETDNKITQKHDPGHVLEPKKETMGDYEIKPILPILPRLHLVNFRHTSYYFIGLMSCVGRMEVATFTNSFSSLVTLSITICMMAANRGRSAQDS